MAKITDEQIAEYGVVACPDTMRDTAKNNKMKFDRLVREVVKPALNDIDDRAVVMEGAEGVREENEAGRVAAESGRVAAEKGRVSAETARVSAETARDGAEIARAAAEAARDDAETLRDTAETARGSAENLRVNAESDRAAAETLRDTAEGVRNTSESARNLAEGLRQTQETTRQNAEDGRDDAERNRVLAEQNRVSVESLRVSAEDGRTNAEAGRISAENARVSSESQRKTNETERKTAEAARQSAEDTRTQAEAERVSAEDARSVWGDYDANMEYVPGNKAAFNGSSYLNIVSCKGIAPTDTAYWRLIAAKGVDGEGAGDMLAAVYDPQGKAQDVFAYADGAVQAVKDAPVLVGGIPTVTTYTPEGGIEGVNYAVDVPGVTTLYEGLEIKVIPHVANTRAIIFLMIKSVGEMTGVRTLCLGDLGEITYSILGTGLFKANVSHLMRFSGGYWVIQEIREIDMALIRSGVLIPAMGGTGSNLTAFRGHILVGAGDCYEPFSPDKVREHLGIAPGTGTYAELKALRDSGGLIPGRQYILTGYKTKYQQPISNVIKETSVGDAGERLVLTAATSDSFYTECASLDFPQDIVYFDMDDVVCEDNATPREGFILRRIDTTKNISYPHDWRTMLWIRYKPRKDVYTMGGVETPYAVWETGKTVDPADGRIYKDSRGYIQIVKKSGIPENDTDSNFFHSLSNTLMVTNMRVASKINIVDGTHASCFLLPDMEAAEEHTTFQNDQHIKDNIQDIDFSGYYRKILLGNVFKGMQRQICATEGVTNCTFLAANNGLHFLGRTQESIFFGNNQYLTLNGPFNRVLFIGITSSLLACNCSSSVIGNSFYNLLSGTISSSSLFNISQSEMGGSIATSFIGATQKCTINGGLQRVICPGAVNAHIKGSFNTRDLSRLSEIACTKTLTTNAADNAVLCWRDTNNTEHAEILP